MAQCCAHTPQSIIEKLVLEQATIVLVPPPSCSHSRSLSSSFSREVCQTRAKADCRGITDSSKSTATGSKHKADDVPLVVSSGEVGRQAECWLPPACVEWEVA